MVRRVIVPSAFLGLLVSTVPLVAAFSGLCGVPLVCSQWEDLYNGSVSKIDRYKAVTTSPDGTVVYAVGESDDNVNSPTNGTAAAFDAATGAVLWRVKPAATAIFEDVAASPDGSSLYLTGTASADYYTEARDASDGSLLWSAFFDQSDRSDVGHHVAVTPDGATVIVSGSSFNTSGTDSWDYGVVSYDAATGAERWFTSYNYNQNAEEEAGLSLSPSGLVAYVTGRSYNTSMTGYEVGTIALSVADGDMLWQNRFNSDPGNNLDYGVDVQASPDGASVVIAGYSLKTGYSYNVTVARLSASTGTLIWDARWDGAGHSRDEAAAVAVAPDSLTAYVTGLTYDQDAGNDGVANMVTIAYRMSDGAKLWESIYNGTGGAMDRGADLVTSPLGSVLFVSGQSYGLTTGTPTFQDIVTNAYNAATGTLLWTHRIEHANHDAVTDIERSPDGRRLFVAGLGTDNIATQNFNALVEGYDLVNLLGP
ncbi:MAG: outer membrane protein assembly factor BamB family protein [Methanobacteriota archaeon]